MVLEAPHTDYRQHLPAWPWKTGMIVESPALAGELAEALQEMNAEVVLRGQPTGDLLEVSRLIEKQGPDLLFVELSRVPGGAQQWIEKVRGGESTLVAAVHSVPDPVEMISALRAGACEFIHLPVRPALFEAMDRISAVLDSRRSAVLERGFTSGFLSAKGGCGATTIACNVAIAAGAISGARRVLLVDLDHQAPGAHRLLRISSPKRLQDAMDSARRLSSATWVDFVTPVSEHVDLLAGSEANTSGSQDSVLDAWRIENLFRFVTRHYGRVVADLGRNLNPLNWAYLQSLDELVVVTAPDVLALYQTRQILQTLSSRGFERSRVRLILNRNHIAPEDFWVESIEQMFDINVLETIPNEYAGLNNASQRDRYTFPAGTAFARAMTRLAGKLTVQANEQGRNH
jgi:pilus assembly protein CpaE